jgi:two-component system, LytTR family, response regulator
MHLEKFQVGSSNGYDEAKMRLRLSCSPVRRALISELLDVRALGPDEEAPLALTERGMQPREALALVFDPERLEELPSLLDALAERSPGQAQSIALRSGECIELIPLKSVFYFEASGQGVRCYASSSSGEVKERLYELEERLPSSRFARVSKSAIVNLGSVREVHPWFGRSLLLRFGVEGRQVEVSRNYVNVLKDRLGI